MTTTQIHHLYDSTTGEDLGPATSEQVAASDASEAKGRLGHFDCDGRTVYTEQA